MPMNWQWYQYLFAGYLIGAGSVTICAWLFGHKKAPGDVAASDEGQGIKDMTIISQEAKECKR